MLASGGNCRAGCCSMLLSSVISFNIRVPSRFTIREQSSLTLGSISPFIEVISADLKSTRCWKKLPAFQPSPLLRFIPHVQEVGIARRGHVPPAFVNGAIERGSDVFLAFR